MKKRIRFAALLAAVLLTAAVLSGCAILQRFLPNLSFSEPQPEDTLKAQAELGTYHVETDENGNVSMTANVTIPDYSLYIEKYIDEAESLAEDEDDFEAQLYALLAAEAAENESLQMTQHEVYIDLTALNSEKVQADWMYDELVSAAQDTAFEKEIEEYCLQLLAETFPEEFSYIEAETDAESEVPAE